jgi:hypothetical protein
MGDTKMRLTKVTFAFFAVLSFVAIAVSAASAETDPVLLFAGQKGTISEGGGTLSTLDQFFSISCAKSAGAVEAGNDADTFKGEIEFKECPFTGLGQSSGVVKFKFKGLTCLTGKETELKPCAFVEATENVHGEVPILGLISFLLGSSQACALSEDGKAVTFLVMTCTKSATGDETLTSVKDLGVELKPKINVLEKEAGEETMGVIEARFKISFTNAGTLDG